MPGSVWNNVGITVVSAGSERAVGGDPYAVSVRTLLEIAVQRVESGTRRVGVIAAAFAEDPDVPAFLPVAVPSASECAHQLFDRLVEEVNVDARVFVNLVVADDKVKT